jgi:hypothetical protein
MVYQGAKIEKSKGAATKTDRNSQSFFEESAGTDQTFRN